MKLDLFLIAGNTIYVTVIFVYVLQIKYTAVPALAR